MISILPRKLPTIPLKSKRKWFIMIPAGMIPAGILHGGTGAVWDRRSVGPARRGIGAVWDRRGALWASAIGGAA